jgi:superfamily II DNA or RNA helicase
VRVVLDGPAPSWVAGFSDQDLRTRLGAGPYARGAAYTRQRAVTSLTLQAEGERILATVRGSGSRSYSTAVTARPLRSGAPGWSGRCSCPMQVDCKHVAAVLLTTRRWLAQTKPVAAASSWETALADVVRADTAGETGAPLGLQVEVVEPPHAYAGAAVRVPRLRLRPVTPGKNGRWIRKGVSWRDLESGYAAVTPRPGHREALRSVFAAFRARQPSYFSPYSDLQVHLDDLGAGGYRLLAEAQSAGVALLDGDAARPVELAGGPARVAMDIRQPDPQADAELAMAVRIPGVESRAPGQVVLVGSPAHGVFVNDPERLVLAAFDRPLDPPTQRLLQQGAPRIPSAELPRFLSRYYPALRQRVAVECGDGSVELPEILPPRLALDVAFEPGHRTAVRWAYAYSVAREVLRVPLAGGTEQVARDVPAERALLAGVHQLPDLPGSWIDAAGRRQLAPETVLTGIGTARFVDQLLPVLLEREDVTVSITGTPAQYAETAETPVISVSAHDSEQPHADWFDLSVNVTVDGQEVPLASLLAALAHGEDHLVLDSGTWFRLDRPELQSLRRLLEEARSLQDPDSTGLRVTAYQAGLWEELVSLGVVAHQSERWSAAVGSLLGLTEVPRPEPPLKLQATLRPYQLEGYHWLSLLWDHQLGGILADDMGLGKTLQTLAMAVRAYEQGTLGGAAGPLLIVAPTSVVATWASEVDRFCPDLAVVAVTETERRSGRSLADLVAGAHLVVTSYALLRIDEQAYRDLPWSGLVLDEAQFVKNSQAKTYQCARRLPAPFKLAITGTPLENSLMDLWSMLSITAPGLFPNPQRFSDLYRKPIESGQSPEQLATLRRRVRPLMLRRTKDQVAADLPPKVEQVLEVTLNPQHRRVYDKHLQRERQRVLGLLGDLQKNRIAIFRSLTLLRQLSLDASLVDEQHAGKVRSSKIDVLLEQLREVVDEGHRVLVFSQFTGFLSLVRDRLDEDGIGYCYLDGRTRNRPRRIAEFTQGDAPVFLISLKAGGVGLTLTEADYVFVLDPWWNPAAEAQAIDRAHRIGQTRTVMVYRMVATGTIEEKVVALQQRKRDLFARVVDDDAMTGGALTAEDIRGLFA